MKTQLTNKPFFFCEYAKFLYAACFIILLFLAVLFFLPGKNASAKNSIEPVYKIASVPVETGDSLWSIASKYYSKEFSSLQDYISEIKRMNCMMDDTVYAGGYLLVPYYSNE